MKILLFGKNGQVGWELQRSLAPLGELVALDMDNQALCGDLTTPSGIKETIQTISPEIIVNAAAYTAVDKAEQEPELAHAINAQAPGVLAQTAKQIDAWLIHYSTDYVFDGHGTHERLETDPTNPLNVYGASKLAGEQNIVDSGCKHLIFRTSWVCGTHGHNFIKTILRLAQERNQLDIVDDQIGAPTGAELLADVTAHAIFTAIRNPDVSGLYHLVAKEHTSWYGFATFIVNHVLQHTTLPLKISPDTITPIASENFPLPAKRPLNSRLSIRKLENTFGVTLPAWQNGVTRILNELLEKNEMNIRMKNTN